jgi:hypothetical protein
MKKANDKLAAQNRWLIFFSCSYEEVAKIVLISRAIRRKEMGEI